MVSQALQVHHRLPPLGQGLEQVGLARAGAPSQQQQRQGPLKTGQHPAPEGLVATIEEHYRQLKAAGQPGHAARAHTTTPTMQANGLARHGKGAEPLGQLLEPGTHQGQPQQHGRLSALLLVADAHLGPLPIAKQGQVDGLGNMALVKFAGAANVHQRAAGRQEGIHGQRWGAAWHG